MTDNAPVLVAVGQTTYRDKDAGRTLVDAMEDAARVALEDAACPALAEAIDAVVTVPFMMNAVPQLAPLMTPNPGALLRDRLGLDARLYTAGVGGSLPQFFVNRFADRLVTGECRAVMIAGSELLATLFSALRSGGDLSAWTEGGSEAAESLGQDKEMTHPAEHAHGLFEPINVYPIFESALRHHKGLDSDSHLALIAGITSRASQVAAGNPYAWNQTAMTPEEALSTDNGNRIISYPYTKVMNAILRVDMAAAVIMTTAGAARDLGIAEERMIYLRGGAEAHDVEYFAERVDFHSSPALRAVGHQALAMSGLTIDDMNLFDLYSCFPSAVQVACDALGLAVDDPRGLTVTGGLTLFGGPGNNYSLHGIAEMVSRLRERGTGHGLVNANGGYITKHAVGIYSTEPGGWDMAQRVDLQAALDAMPHPELETSPQGRGVIEGHCVRYEGGEPAVGIIVGRLDSGKRFLAHTRPDPAVLAELIGADAVGRDGTVTPGKDTNLFEF